MATPMLASEPCIGGLVPFSSVDWPGQLAAVVFVAGCPWRCEYCHNPHLQTRRGNISWDDCLALLKRRVGLLDAVVFSGGEPLAEPNLPEMIASVRALGLKAGMHTGGAYLRRLTRCLPLLDWVGLDVKQTFELYDALTGIADSGKIARQALECLVASGVPFECRTTIHPHWHSEQNLLDLGSTLADLGVTDYALQGCRPMGDAANHIHLATPASFPSSDTLSRLAGLFEHFCYRQA